MAESALSISFGEPAAGGGARIPVRALSPALLALGELVADASVLIDPDREPATLYIDRIEAGSSMVHLVVSVSGEASRLTDLLSTDPATTLSRTLDAIIGPHGLLQLARHAHGAGVVGQRPADGGGLVLVELDGGEQLQTLETAAAAYLERSGRRRVIAVLGPLQQPGVETLELSSPTLPPVRFTRQDADALSSAPTPVPGPVEREVEMLVDVAAPAFPVNNKWRLQNGLVGSFWATIGDGAFLNRVNAGEPFRKGDSLRCLFTITQTETSVGVQTEHHVTRVLQHVARGQQLRLDDAA